MISDEAIERLAAGFDACTLRDEQWTHAAHLVVALRCLCRHETNVAIEKLRTGIKRINASLAKTPDAYHETMTIAWIRLIETFLATEDRRQSLSALAHRLIERCGDPSYIFTFYTREVLFSPEARTTWVPPDRRPLYVLNDS